MTTMMAGTRTDKRDIATRLLSSGVATPDYLLEALSITLDDVRANNYALLGLAIRANQHAAIDVFLRLGITRDDLRWNKWWLVHWAIYRGNGVAIRRMVDLGLDWLAVEEYDWGLFEAAVKYDYIGIVMLFVNMGIDAAAIHRHLGPAFVRGNTTIIRWLIERDPWWKNPSAVDTSHPTGMYMLSAAACGHIDAIMILMDRGLTIDTIVRCGGVAQAAEYGRLDVLRRFVDRAPDQLAAVRAHDNRALRDAARRGHLEVVQYLIALGLGLDDLRAARNYALRGAAARGHLRVVKCLVAAGLTRDDVVDLNNEAINLSRHGDHIATAEYLEWIVRPV